MPLFYPPRPAQAGLFGDNSQTVGLSSGIFPTLNSAYTGGGDIAISDDALLPEAGVLGTAADLVDYQPESDQISLYTVRSGDSLSGIAKMFKVSANTIRWANNLGASSVLREGQVLTILPVNGVRHAVLAGETVASIAKKYGGDAEEIVQFNGLASAASLSVGQVVLIPGGEEPETRTKTTAPTRSSAGPSYPGYYTRPLAGGVKTQGLHGNNGVDLASYQGAPIVAAAGGRVIVAREGGWNGGYGNYVVVEHPNGTQTLYAHLLDVAAGVGQVVAQGDVIGHLGNTGKSTGPHLHFEVRGAKNPF